MGECPFGCDGEGDEPDCPRHGAVFDWETSSRGWEHLARSRAADLLILHDELDRLRRERDDARNAAKGAVAAIQAELDELHQRFTDLAFEYEEHLARIEREVRSLAYVQQANPADDTVKRSEVLAIIRGD